MIAFFPINFNEVVCHEYKLRHGISCKYGMGQCVTVNVGNDGGAVMPAPQSVPIEIKKPYIKKAKKEDDDEDKEDDDEEEEDALCECIQDASCFPCI